MSPDDWNDLQTMAGTIWGEARGDGIEGMEAVACVIHNRFHARKWFTGYHIENGVKVPDIKQTCLKKYQFSCWNRKDPNFSKIIRLNKSDKTFCLCLEIATRVLSGKLPDFTNNATFYHTRAVRPKWAQHHSPCYETEHHLFYNDVN